MTKKLLIILAPFLFLNVLLSTPELLEKNLEAETFENESIGKVTSSLTSLESEPSSTIYNCVNVISGSYAESIVDYVVPGPEPIAIHRTYSSSEDEPGSLCYGWHSVHGGRLERKKSKVKEEGKGYQVTITGGGGSQLVYGEAGDGVYHLHKKSYEKGLTNTGSGFLSGRTNPLNDKLVQDRKKENFTLTNGGGVVSRFKKMGHSFILMDEIRPNGTRTVYSEGSLLGPLEIKSLGREGNLLALARFSCLSQTSSVVSGNDSRSVAYSFETKKSKRFLTHAKRPFGPDEWYSYSKPHKKKPSRLVKKQNPDGRCLEIEYFEKGKNEVPFGMLKISDSDDPILGRVKALKAPVGHDQTLQYIYKFRYKINTEYVDYGKKTERLEVSNGTTSVYDVYNRLTRYHYNRDYRLCCVGKYLSQGPNHPLYSFEKLFWDGPRLTNRIFHTKEGWPQYCHQYDYDDRGNVWRETLWGNLSGYNSQPISHLENGYPEYNGCEFEFKLYTYTNDGLNLVQSMTEGHTSETKFTYIDGTDILTKKLQGPIGSIKRRNFYEYDANGTAVKEFQDDGSSLHQEVLDDVTERKITYIIPTTTAPCGLPAITDEKYFDFACGQERLLKKTIQVFSPEGWPLRKETYDSNGHFAFAENWQYNECGSVTYYEDPAGRVTTKSYDANNNLVYEQGPRLDFHVEYAYDFCDRLIKKETVLEDGQRLAERYFYDLASNKVATEDIYGNRISHKCDEFGRVVETTLPPVLDENGQVMQPQLKTVYNEMSFPHDMTDARGFSTHKRFTVKGSPYHITYPDGSFESFIYNVDNTVQKKIHKNGSYTTFEYDYQKRETKREVFSKGGELLDGCYKTYTGFKLLEERTLGGLTTTNKYDSIGRVIETCQNGVVKNYLYDALSRLTETRTFFGPNEGDYIAKIHVFDSLGQVIEEREESSSGDILARVEYEYDYIGNRNAVINHTKAGLAVTRTKHDPFGNPIEIIDPQGNVSRVHYSYSTRNSLGQYVAHQDSTDPSGNVTSTTSDALGRIVLVTRKNRGGDELQRAEFYYDANGNKARLVETIYTPNAEERVSTTIWEYDSCNRLVNTVEAAGEPIQKQTRLVYNLSGQKERLIKPDGKEIFYTYNSLERLKAVKSSDETISLEYTYDQNANIIRVDTLPGSMATVNNYDKFNRLISERLGNGLVLKYAYDQMGRLVRATLPDDSGVEYVYNASFLHMVKRIDRSGNVACAHTYSEHDLGGKVLLEEYAGNAGRGSYAYDVMGRFLSYASNDFKETIEGYDVVGNITEKEAEDPIGKVDSRYRYDDLFQLMEETGTAKNQYACDSVNNRVSKNGVLNTVNALNQLVFDGKSTYFYDSNGNLKGKSSPEKRYEYEYDALDRLTAVTSGEERFVYAYDELNRRLSKTQFQWNEGASKWMEVSKKRFLYHGKNEAGFADAAGVICEYRMLGAGRGAEIGAAVLMEIEGETFVPIHGHNGSVVMLVDAKTGSPFEVYRYSAFGEEQLFDEAGNALESSINPWRFSSKRFDEETGFVYFGLRYYAADIGRWISADPLGFEAGPNLYAYVLNNPLSYCDLYGLIAEGGFFSGLYNGASSILQAGLDAFNYGRKIPGHAVEFAAFHLVIIPPLQNAIRAIGTLMRGESLAGFQTWKDMRSRTGDLSHLGREERDPNDIKYQVNGICNSFEEFFTNVLATSERMGGYNVHYCYNSSHGFLADALEVIGQRMGFGMHPSELMAKDLGRIAAGLGPDGIIDLHAHSQGGEITACTAALLSDDCLQKIQVSTYGSCNQIAKGKFKDVVNYVSSRDVVPYLSPLHMGKTLICGNTNTVILPSNYFGVDHAWNGDTYRNQFYENLDNKYNSKPRGIL